MRFKLQYAAIVLLLAGCAGEEGSVDPNQPFDSATTAQIERTIDEVLAANDIPGAVVEIRIPGRGHYLAGHGVRNTVSGAAMQTADHFRIGSNTKGFIGTLILMLAKRGDLTLDQKVGTILNGVPNGNNISIRNL